MLAEVSLHPVYISLIMHRLKGSMTGCSLVVLALGVDCIVVGIVAPPMSAKVEECAGISLVPQHGLE